MADRAIESGAGRVSPNIYPAKSLPFSFFRYCLHLTAPTNFALWHQYCTPYFLLNWPSVSVVYSYKTATYRITIVQINDSETSHWRMDNVDGEGNAIQLADDGLEHEAAVYISAPAF
jgi:hypothetical protein